MDTFTVKNVFIFFLLGSTIISFYVFINALILKNKQYIEICNTWQFPMLLALTLELIFNA